MEYVFVDDLHRYKRLKVTRACESCRRRKVKCDGGSGGSQIPCTSCRKLKIECVFSNMAMRRAAPKTELEQMNYDGGKNSNKSYVKELDEKPVLYKIYNGKVTNIKDFGAFIGLEGVKGRVEGMVHVSMLVAGRRVSHPTEVVSRNQQVKVKVMSVAASRISLSMKDVDQITGQDLTPHLH
ncbi:14079_t:CDS:2 [Entrophospora sp. SA101]|nr:14079_t:CDS:2 [Entrophospora sp. SA101]